MNAHHYRAAARGAQVLLVLATGLLLSAACRSRSDEDAARKEEADAKARAIAALAPNGGTQGGPALTGEARYVLRRAAARENWDKSRDGRRQVYTSMKPAQRAAELQKRCPVDGPCDRTWEVIVYSAATNAERTQLTTIATRVCVPCEMSGRDGTVGQIADYLINGTQRARDVRVDARGPEKRHLDISCSLCSEDYIEEFAHGSWATRLRDSGFQKATCRRGASTWTTEID